MIHPKIAAFTALCLVVAAILFGVIISQQPEGTAETATGTLTTAAEVRDYLERMQALYGQSGMYREMDGMNITPAAISQESGAAGKSSDFIAPSLAGTAYSTTNLQVAGVDEADFVKNDGRYIYVISGNQLVIIDAYPADRARIISETPLTGSPQEMFLDGGRLVILTTSWEGGPVYDTAGTMAMMPPRYGGRSTTHALIYSLADRSRPELARDITLTGSYYDARMIDGYVYAVTSEPVYIRDPVPMPMVSAGDSVVSPPIRYFDLPSPSYQYYTVSAFRTTGSAAPAAETYLLGYGTTLYVSGGNMYIAYQSTLPVAPAVPVDGPVIRNEETLSPRETTTVHRIAIGDGRIQYKAKGTVPGHLLNQFSMDEYGGNLRVATTVSGWSSRMGSSEYNNVYILSEKMETIGKLEGLAPDERIYATRFIGDRLYMVTFKRIDPLFVIDLADPAKPAVLGKLKIPGYSDYLHPYDANHLIGIGKETEANEWGGVSTSGLKLALFDVSDVEHPKQVEALVIGEAGTDSEALRDHRAFLFDRKKNLLVIPVSENTVRAVDGTGRMPYYPSYWQGAYVFGVDPDGGFTLKGKVRHLHGGGADGYWWTGAVMRSLYIDDTLYTISRDLVVASDLGDLSKPVAELELPTGPQILRSGMVE